MNENKTPDKQSTLSNVDLANRLLLDTLWQRTPDNGDYLCGACGGENIHTKDCVVVEAAKRLRSLPSATLTISDVAFLERVSEKFHNALANATTMREPGRREGFDMLIQFQSLLKALKKTRYVKVSPDIEGENATHNDEPPCSERT